MVISTAWNVFHCPINGQLNEHQFLVSSCTVFLIFESQVCSIGVGMVSRKILFFNLFFFFNVTCKRCRSNKWTDMLKFMKLAETRFELIQLERETWSRKSVFVHVFMSNPIENSVSDAQKIIIIEMSPRTSIFWVLHSYQFTPRKI